VFNCGIGMVIEVSAADAPAVQRELEQLGERAWHIGEISGRHEGEAQTTVA
jgi:phosphoribosylformylglycinamidine cyclo-ligase